MVDKHSMPAFSIAGGHRSSPAKTGHPVPGPGAYDTLTTLTASKSGTNLKSDSKRFKDYQTAVPGPGTYDKTYNNSHVQTAVILSRVSEKKKDDIPGPGAYEPNYKTVVKTQSGHKIPHSEKLADIVGIHRKLPGPGQYDTGKSTVVHLEQATKFGGQKRHELALSTKTPGPGQYNSPKQEQGKQAPQIVFGKSGRSLSTNTLVPGPGAYTIPDKFQQSISKSKGFSISIKRDVSKSDIQSKQKIPGPGAYNIEDTEKHKHKSIGYSLGKAPRLKIQNQKQLLKIPGPQKYSYNLQTFDNRTYQIGKEKRKGLGVDNKVPGPGAYDAKLHSTLPQFSIPKSNKSWLTSTKNPGPGSYQPKPVFNEQYSSIGVNKDQRKPFYDQKKGIPGPGQYLDQGNVQKKQGQGFTIGHQKRGQMKDSKMPGPGFYNIPSTIANLPSYVKP